MHYHEDDGMVLVGFLAAPASGAIVATQLLLGARALGWF
jgi:hypothetical protein